MKQLLVLILLLSSTNVMAFDKGEELLRACNTDLENVPNESYDEASLKVVLCAGYIHGMLDSAQVIFSIMPMTRLFCSPEQGISRNQMMRIVTKWLEDHPSGLHKQARESVLLAFIDAFPCGE